MAPLPQVVSSSWVIYRVEQSAAFSILSGLVSSSNLPNGILKNVTTRTMGVALESDSSPTRNLHSLLASLQQRHPNVVEDVLRLTMDENVGQEEAIDQLLLSLSVVGRTSSLVPDLFDRFHQKTSHPEQTPMMDMVVLSMDVNGETRAAAVRGMLRTLRESVGFDPEALVGKLSHVLPRY